MKFLRKDRTRVSTRLTLGALVFSAGLLAAPMAGWSADTWDVTPFEARPVTELTVREGPGPRFPAIGVIDPHGTADVIDCLQDTRWCEVIFNDTTGWVNSDFLLPETRGLRVAALSAAPDAK